MEGDVKAATDILCELQVETFGSMSKREKTEFILAQVQLCIEVADWNQAAILSRKISTKYLSRRPKKTLEQIEQEKKSLAKKKARGEDVSEEKEEDVTDLKLRYYTQQIILAKHDGNYLDVCKHYRQVLDTEAVEEDPDKLKPVSSVNHAEDACTCSVLLLRCCNASSTLPFLPHTIMSNMTFYNASSAIHATRLFLGKKICLRDSPFVS